MIRGGFVSATSVRWDPQEWEWRKAKRHETEDEVLVFTKQELLESSYVTIPADPGALVLRADSREPIDRSLFRPEPSPEELARSKSAARLEQFADALERTNQKLKGAA